MQAPLVSVIMPAFNCEAYLRHAIESILDQTFTDFELIICDDGSTDNSWAIIDAVTDKRVTKFRNEKNLGYLRAYNFLLSKTRGGFITCQDADDWSEKTRLEDQLNVFAEHPDISLCGVNGTFYYDDHLQKKCPAFSSGYIFLNEGNYPFMLPAIMYKREVLDSVKGFHPYFDRLTGMDQYFILNILSEYKGYALNKYLYTARFNPTSNHRTLDDIRKLTTPDAYYLLKRQRIETGSDWLKEGKDDLLLDFERQLTKNSAFLSEKFREYAAYRVDSKLLNDALRLLFRAFVLNPMNKKIYNTFLYALRKKLNL
jgi:glycosyltransferase involved in cell wall biosynthesis